MNAAWLALALGVLLVLLTVEVGGTGENLSQPWPHEVAVVIHSFDGYVRYWRGMLHYWHQHTRHLEPYPSVWLATETLQPEDKPEGVKVVNTGVGTWAWRLRQALQHVKEPYVLYLQEDAWLTGPLYGYQMQRWLTIMRRQRLNVLKLNVPCRHDPAAVDDFNNPLWYTVTHQPSLWRKDFLLSTLYDEQEALAHELETNAMLHRHPEWEQTCQCCEDSTSLRLSYVEVSRQGQLLPVGVKMLEDLVGKKKSASSCQTVTNWPFW